MDYKDMCMIILITDFNSIFNDIGNKPIGPFEARVHAKDGDKGVVCYENTKSISKRNKEFDCTTGSLKGAYLEIKPKSGPKFFICELVVMAGESEYYP